MQRALPPLNLPQAPLKLARKDGAVVVWDEIRKRYLVLTPEEWVRQHFIHYLLSLNYPASNISVEAGLQLGKLSKRTDILVYKNNRPFLLVECKAPSVAVSQSTLDQASRYNSKIEAPFLALSNGLVHFAAKRLEHGLEFLDRLPPYSEI